ncbi:MAG TPA: NADH-quinone oxidoreductase subunit M [Candidatus Dormibacteraeota bacterium]
MNLLNVLLAASPIPTALASPSPSPSPISPFGPTLIHFNFLLSTLVWAPIVVAVLIALMPNPRGRYDRTIRQTAFWTCASLLFLTLVMYGTASLFSSAPVFEENVPWLPALGINYHLGVDGITIPLFLTGSLIGVVAVLASVNIRERVREYFVLLLLVQGTVNGVLSARDTFVLVLFWGAGVLPVSLLLAGWGGPGRRLAAGRYLAYGTAGTIALGAAVLTLYAATGGISFDLDYLGHALFNPRLQVVIAILLVIAAATRLPLVPLHGWARDVFAEATPGVAILIAGIAARLGGYVLIRLLVIDQHDGAQVIAPFLAALAAATVLYPALVALRTRDIRRFGAYVALVPGGVFALGIAGMTSLALLGATLQLVVGGLAAALVVGVTATIAERAETRDVELMGGLAPRMPKLSWMLVLAGMGVVGVPGFASFVAEAMTLFGSFRSQPGASFVVLAGLALLAVALAYAFQRILFGSRRPDAPGASDASLGEMWYLGLLVGLLLWWGVLPGGPKLGGAVPLPFDEGIVNVINNTTADIMSAYPVAVVP